MQNVLLIESASVIRNGITLLDSINWEIKQNEHWAIIGRNGSGKTLTLQMILGYLWPSKGQITLLQEKFGECNLRELRKQVAWVSHSLQFQMMQPWNVLEIVLSGFHNSIGLHDEVNPEMIAKAKDLLIKLECQDLLDRNYDTLSCGEQKRILLARALVVDPKLLILDEPCTGLDLKSREEFLNWIEENVKDNNNLNVIFVSHHIEEIMPFISHCLLVKNGKIIGRGAKELILNNQSLGKCLDLNGINLEQINKRYFVSYK
mgnify:CR=1 FL=1